MGRLQSDEKNCYSTRQMPRDCCEGGWFRLGGEGAWPSAEDRSRWRATLSTKVRRRRSSTNKASFAIRNLAPVKTQHGRTCLPKIALRLNEWATCMSASSRLAALRVVKHPLREETTTAQKGVRRRRSNPACLGRHKHTRASREPPTGARVSSRRPHGIASHLVGRKVGSRRERQGEQNSNEAVWNGGAHRSTKYRRGRAAGVKRSCFCWPPC